MDESVYLKWIATLSARIYIPYDYSNTYTGAPRTIVTSLTLSTCTGQPANEADLDKSKVYSSEFTVYT
jgi:hypothetical protein